MGTRLLMKELRDNVIDATIITDPAAGQLAHISQISMVPTDFIISFERLHFPIEISFALTRNKFKDKLS